MAVFWWEGYRIYAGCIFLISALSIIATLYDTITNNTQIRKMARYTCQVELCVPRADGTIQLQKVDSSELVPGDVIKIPESVVLPCDLVLMTGSAIVNEAILTGESIPVIKQSLPVSGDEIYFHSECTKYTLFGGTSVI